ncbi:MAG: hydrolase, alpha/beta fold family [Clostridia bacterium]|jgi:pimeloyl-ACP methyl ester carboxylesterase|nr:hydrolase, alpha/beta fold family [Clostridia bacterium]
MNKFLLDIGTKKLEVKKSGTTGPIIIIETGMGVSMYDWHEVIRVLEKTATVIAYHRSGYGESSPVSDEKRVISDITNDLHLLIQHMNISEPIILVAHSFGGVCAQHFAIQYPDLIKGIVLVDASPTDYTSIEQLKSQLPVINERYNSSKVIERFNGFASKTYEELRELFKPRLMPGQEKLIEDLQRSILDFGISPMLYKAMANELNNIINSKLSAEDLIKFPQVPLRVLVRDRTIEINKLVDAGVPYSEAEQLENLVQTLIREQSDLSKKGKLIEAKQCGHTIYRENPDIVILAIQQVIDDII